MNIENMEQEFPKMPQSMRDMIEKEVEKQVKVTPQRGEGFDKIAERIYNFPEVKALYLMSGAYDFMVMLEGKTMKEISMFTSSKLAPLEAVLSTATHFVLKKYKDHGTVLEAKKADKRQAVTP